MHKGIVIEMTEADLVVLTPDGQFKRIPRMGRACRIGEEIRFSTPPFRLKRPVLSAMFALAAAVLLCIVLFNGLGANVEGVKPVVAYVTLDINPSVELGIGSDNLVVEARGLNDDGNRLLEGLSLTGTPLAEATAAIMSRAEENGYFSQQEGDVIIASTKVSEEAPIDETSLGQIVQETVTKHIEQTHPEASTAIEVTAFVTPPTIREEALAQGVSAGKYAVYLSAKNNGNAIDLDDLKNDSVHKIAEKSGGIGKLIDRDNLPKKEALSRLLEAEKKGELDKKLKEMAEKSGSKNGDDKSSTKSTVATPSKNADGTGSKNSGKDDAKGGSRNSDDRSGNGNNGAKSNNPAAQPEEGKGRNEPAARNGGNSGIIPASGFGDRLGGREDDRDRRDNGPGSNARNSDDREKEEALKKEEERKSEETKRLEEWKKQEEAGRQGEQRKANEDEAKRKFEEELKKKEEEKQKEAEKKKEEEKRKEEERKRQEERSRQSDAGRPSPGSDGRADDRTDGQTDGRTDGRTGNRDWRDALPFLRFGDPGGERTAQWSFRIGN